MHLTSAGISTVLHDMTAVKVRIPTSFTSQQDVDESAVGEVPRTCWAELGEHRPREQRSLLRVSSTLCVVARREMKPHSWVWLRRMQVTLENEILPDFLNGKLGFILQLGILETGTSM